MNTPNETGRPPTVAGGDPSLRSRAGTGATAGEARAAKKPYRKPTVRFERVFEVSALTCGKVQQTQSSCAHNRKNS